MNKFKTAEDYLRNKYGAYRGSFSWCDEEKAFNAGIESQADCIAQLEADLAESQAALKMAREWSKGDKWRFSEVAQEYAAWENYVDVLDAAIKDQQ